METSKVVPQQIKALNDQADLLFEEGDFLEAIITF